MPFTSALNYKTVKRSSLELIIIISYCFLGVHSWLGEAQKTTSVIEEQSNVVILFCVFSFDFTNECILSLLLHSDLCHMQLASPLKSAFLPFIACPCEAQKIKQMIWVIIV